MKLKKASIELNQQAAEPASIEGNPYLKLVLNHYISSIYLINQSITPQPQLGCVMDATWDFGVIQA
ncbi:hypothetical protein RND71_026100 [Anisodus tanguticus]|uniref:Uncharacterized protein n=1 Tax=Anisodus tanguticus TaxID=243964 RepID=A0AAE1V811_9SOLA|nr:hypothetical protein RND71_026100 [Anisodus tanguticus]